MKTLEQLGLSKHKTSNYANYIGEEIVCCGWMDIHEDSNNLGVENNKIFKVEPLYWHDDGCFCIKPRNKWHLLSKKDFINKRRVPGISYSEKVFNFDATKYHCFVPRNIAEQLNNKDYEKSKEYLEFYNLCGKMGEPVLVWRWEKS